MSIRWVNAPREVTENSIYEALSRSKGAVLSGPSGVGKTVLARAAVQRFGAAHPDASTHWVSATSSARHIPFGALSHLIEVGAGSDPAEVLRRARLSITPPDRDVVVVIDDAHFLDDYSATLVHQLATVGGARVLVTLRDGEPVPGAITALRKDYDFSRLQVPPLTSGETTGLIEQVLGGSLEADSAAHIYAMSRGNPLYVRHLLEGAAQQDNLRAVDGIWQLRGTTAMTRELAELVDDRLAAMPAPVRHVMDYLSVDEPLAVSVLSALAGAAAIEDAENSDTVRITPLGGALVVFPSHPLFTERLRQSMGSMTARRLRTELVRCLSGATAADSVHLSDRLRLIALAIDSDSPPHLPDLLDAVWKALLLNDFVLTERLATAALQHSDALPARLALAHAQCWQGRGDAAEATLDMVDADDLADWEMLHWVVSKASNQFWMLRQCDAAVDWITSMRDRMRTEPTRFTVDALTAQFAMNLGDPQRCLDLATPVLAAPDMEDLAVAWASSAAALCSARMGRFAEVNSFTDRCLQVVHPDAVRYAAVLGQVLTAILDCRLDTAEQNARHHLDLAEFRQPSHSVGQVVLSYALIASGSLPAAVSTLRSATPHYADTRNAWESLHLTLLATALGQLGDQQGAAHALAEAERTHDPRTALHYPELCSARAWTLAAAHNVPGATAAARNAIREATNSGQLGQALLAHHDAIRLGDVSGLSSLTRLAERLDCAMAPMVLNHARGLASRDGTRLAQASADFESAGMLAAAADAAAHAASSFAVSRDRGGETAARDKAAELRRRCGGLNTPALLAVLSPLPLTAREREIALLVAAGKSNKAIAEQLHLSVRTVEAHIYNACTKLDVANRAALARTVNAVGDYRPPPSH